MIFNYRLGIGKTQKIRRVSQICNVDKCAYINCSSTSDLLTYFCISHYQVAESGSAETDDKSTWDNMFPKTKSNTNCDTSLDF